MQFIPNQEDFFFRSPPCLEAASALPPCGSEKKSQTDPLWVHPTRQGKRDLLSTVGLILQMGICPWGSPPPHQRGRCFAGVLRALLGDGDSFWGLPKGWLLAGPRWSLRIEGAFPTDHPFPFGWWCKLRPKLVLKVGYAGKSTDHSAQTPLCKHFNWI